MTWWDRLLGKGDKTDLDPHVPSLAAMRDAGIELPPLLSLGTTRSGREVVAFRAAAGDLVPWWHRVRDAHSSTGLWPVLLGPDPGDLCAALPSSGSSDDYDEEQMLARAAGMSVGDLVGLRAERLAAYGHDLDEDAEDDPEPSAPVELSQHAAAFTVAQEDGLVGLVPAAAGWEVPAILGWQGGVNYDLEPLDHVVTLRDWHSRFGAELVSLSSDQVLELLVPRPPSTPSEALDVATEHYAYCADVVDQGVGTITALAAEQAVSESWYFWWD